MNYTPLDLERIKKTGRKRRLGFPLILFLASLFIFILFSSTLFAVAYTNFKPPFISQDLQRRLKLYFAFLPVLPKTKEQIILATASKASKVKSFDMGFSGALTLSYSGFDFNFDLQGKSKMDFWDEVKNELELEGKLSGSFGEYSAGIRTIYLDGDSYFKFDNLPDELFSYAKVSLNQYGINLSDEFFQRMRMILTSKWIKAETPSKTAARREIQKKQEEDTKKLYQNLRESVLNLNSLKKVELAKKDGLYVFYTSYSGHELMKSLQNLILKEGKVLTEDDRQIMDKIAEGIKEFKITVEVGEKDYFVKKISFLLKGDFKTEEFTNDSLGPLDSFFGPSLGLDAALTFNFSGINERKAIEPPADFVEFKELYQEIQKEVLNEVYGGMINSYSLPSSQIRSTAQELVSKVEEFRQVNGSYPKDINEFLLSFPEAGLAQRLQEYNVVYVSSPDRKSFLVYAPYRVGEMGVEYIVYSGEGKEEILMTSQLQDKVALLKKDVLGAFIKRTVK